MIPVEEAKRITLSHVPPLPFAPVALDIGQGCHLAQDVFARYAHPLFDMSAVDGYAVNGDGPEWKVVGELAAGGVLARALEPGESVRIFTGAQVPTGTRAVLMQEQCSRAGDLVRYDSVPIKHGTNIRRAAEQFQDGVLLLAKGERLNPPAIGLLASAGVEEVEISFKPWVAVVRTGGEFIEEGKNPAGRIFSSNEWMLTAALRAEGCEVEPEGAFLANDDDDEISSALLDASEADAVITTGGVSVGDHDRIAAVLEKLGARIWFHGVAQKPGKPMLFATLNDKPVFALPGNPRAVMVLFWEYVLPFLRAMQGAIDPRPRTEHLPLTHTVQVKGDRAEFRAARIQQGRVTFLADEGSHMLGSLLQADALVYLPADQRAWSEGEPVEVHYIPR